MHDRRNCSSLRFFPGKNVEILLILLLRRRIKCFGSFNCDGEKEREREGREREKIEREDRKREKRER